MRPRTFGDFLKRDHVHRWHDGHICRYCGEGVRTAKFNVRHYVCESCIRVRHDVVLPAVKRAETRQARLAAIRAAQGIV